MFDLNPIVEALVVGSVGFLGWLAGAAFTDARRQREDLIAARLLVRAAIEDGMQSGKMINLGWSEAREQLLYASCSRRVRDEYDGADDHGNEWRVRLVR